MKLRYFVAGLVLVLSLGSAQAANEQCPAKTTQMDDVIAALNEAPGCDRAMKVFEACEYGASGDVQFGAVVEKKCEGDFAGRLKAPRQRLIGARCGSAIESTGRNPARCIDPLQPFAGRKSPSATRNRFAGARVLWPASPAINQAASAALAFSAIAWNAAGSWIARSESTFRSTVMPDFESPSIKRL